MTLIFFEYDQVLCWIFFSDDLIGLFDSPLNDNPKPNTSGTPVIDSTPLIPVAESSVAPLAIMDTPLSPSITFQLPADITSHPVVSGWDKKVTVHPVPIFNLNFTQLLHGHS